MNNVNSGMRVRSATTESHHHLIDGVRALASAEDEQSR